MIQWGSGFASSMKQYGQRQETVLWRRSRENTESIRIQKHYAVGGRVCYIVRARMHEGVVRERLVKEHRETTDAKVKT